ncbi:MAG: AAA family ATPase [Rhizobiales bacterium]|nr:AAA family ATPase [Hyphomicrobiales bacterium]MBO6700332.1 AAA family ATPase [Hyphomicrobiales bacterium]MBO6737503.1 AAA family ATPase [Hyphomicrobiales bacterium]MBO6913440.1 AAA family ATPase [Hyphomicrobiales bacterium]MBO6955371.1 AAA family ATPase [Hyphomicrobiales bacterium]
MNKFATKYAPRSFDDLVFTSADVEKQLSDHVAKRCSGSLILFGQYGTGKTTAAQIIARDRKGSLGDFSIKRNHASDVTAKMIDGVKCFRSSAVLFSSDEHTIWIIDEIDQLDQKLQHRIRPMIDGYGDDVSFFFTTNNLHNVDGGLRDRCDVVEMAAANSDDWLGRAQAIVAEEGINIDEQHLRRVLKATNGSIRSLIRALEKLVIEKRRADQGVSAVA